MSDARAGQSGLESQTCHHFEHLLVDFRVTDGVVFHEDIRCGHVDSRDIDEHWILGLPELCWVLVHAEAFSVELLEHVLKLGSGHLRTT